MIEKAWCVCLAIIVNIGYGDAYVTSCYTDSSGATVTCAASTLYCKMTIYNTSPYTFSGGCSTKIVSVYSSSQVTSVCSTTNCNTASSMISQSNAWFNPSSYNSDSSSSDNSNTSGSFPWYLYIIIPLAVLIIMLVFFAPPIALICVGTANRRRLIATGRPYGPWYNHVRMGQNSLVGQAVVTTSNPSVSGATPVSYTTSYAQPGVYSMSPVNNTGMYNPNAFNPQYNAMNSYNTQYSGANTYNPQLNANNVLNTQLDAYNPSNPDQTVKS